MPKLPVHAHKLVAENANELCNIIYDNLMSNNAIRAEWKRQHPGLSEKGLRNAFLKRNIANCLPAARATLAGMLALPYDSALKDEILEALVLDKSLVAGRAQPAEIMGAAQTGERT